MTDLTPVLERADKNLPSSLDNLFELLRIKSISTDKDYKADCRKAAEWLAAYLKTVGFDASVRDTPGHPMVVAHHEAATPGAPHVLFYGHYDVQPVDPIELWENDPFAPSIKDVGDGRKILTGRGTSDDKGQLMTFVEACRAYNEIHGGLPVKITILFEGEEESGSPSLKPFLEANAAELKADYALVCDTTMWDAETPAIAASLRGMVAEEIVISAADRDLHSGFFGGAAANPIHILADVVAGLHDETGRVTLEGFYEGVEETPANIKASWDNLGSTAENFLGEVGLSIPSGERGRSVLELTWARPTAEVNGIWGGYTGPGFKTVIAAIASAKISFRLVGHQDPAAVRESFRAYVRSKIPADCSVEFHAHGGSPAIQLSYDSPVLTKAKNALSDEWPKPAIVIGMGGSIPIVGDFQRMLGMESLLVGFGLADDRIHSPNEKYEYNSYHKGIRSWIRILAALAA
ncbi:M20/M25/M40 family metallo-hydrolase [Rhizobium sp. BK251]|uniref:M20/M25/M40 family metallo-hydrolase n=1 Tax=Rhizobium sp. BK251 TaxID=2512125 RepID=UPI00104DCAB2|nr:M20/M25/M40 family metallo-hydrolase [Rhizobium sp. BK251]TCL71944.1 acetylornithine deacetylase/succinyl-diaminopimelate desuccinylase-like protein [Rhizobium sp. BK251]